MLVYRPFDSWATQSEWSVGMPEGEQVTGLALGEGMGSRGRGGHA